MARLIPANVAVGEDLAAAERNRLRVATLRAREAPKRGRPRSYITGEAPSTGASHAMSDERRRLLKRSTRGMNNS